MATKSRFRIRSSVLAAIATAIGFLSFASASLADTGGVYFDTNLNAAAGDPAQLFNASLTGMYNAGIGEQVMPNLTSGSRNAMAGYGALYRNTTGTGNVATGAFGLSDNTDGVGNVAAGAYALTYNTHGNTNVAIGDQALVSNKIGDYNVAVGGGALFNSHGDYNVAIGSGPLGTAAGSNLSSGSNNIDIANAGETGESGTIRIGTKKVQKRAYLAGVFDRVASGGVPVVINSKGRLGTASAVSAKSSAANATVRHLVATVKRQQRQIAGMQRQNQRQGKEIRALRAQNG